MESEKYCPVSQQVCKGSSCVFYNPSKADLIHAHGTVSEADADYCKCRIWQNNFYMTEQHRAIKRLISEELHIARRSDIFSKEKFNSMERMNKFIERELASIHLILNRMNNKLSRKLKKPVVEKKKTKVGRPKKKVKKEKTNK